MMPDPQQFSDGLFLLKMWLFALTFVQFLAAVVAVLAYFRRTPSLDRELARIDKLEGELTRVESLVKKLIDIAATQDQISNIKERLDGFARNRVTLDRMSALENNVTSLKADLRADMLFIRTLINDHTRAIGQSEAAHD